MNIIQINKVLLHMKYLLILGLIPMFYSCTSQKSLLSIPDNQRIEIDYPNYKLFQATLTNRSSKDLKVSVLSKQNQEQIRGFGLEGRATAEVMVETENKLMLTNQNNSSLRVALKVRPISQPLSVSTEETISFILKNNSSEVIPLFIPDVMNPNLEPFSESKVQLKIGQEILFRLKAKKYVLLKVSKAIKTGAKIDISKRLQKRKQELGLN